MPETLPALREDEHGVIPHLKAPLPSLYEVEDDLAALLDSEPMTPELETEYRADLARQMALAVRKRDAVGGFIVECENRADFAAQEIKRLQARKNMFIHAADRLRSYVTQIIEQLPLDKKGKPAKLQGERFQMSIRACPASLEITDAEKVPLTYKNVTVTMPAVAYKVIKATLEFPLPSELVAAMSPEQLARLTEGKFYFAKLPAQYSIDNAAVKAALQQGLEVPGADLRIGKNVLAVK